ncbi:uncharacterized protein LOC119590729 [Penaeus monodon]|uniref:uncharacterized protein LOC119590729 n=1 Tax=Penaeus monodon TaxID=6687 RepID=UPI0018A7BBF1|nr:uncharacterized protein LOC119590729 [Penaeus monodon]
MVQCAIATCKMIYKNRKRFVSFYSFPHDRKLAKKWLDACRRNDLWHGRQIKPWHAICSMHFEAECFNYHLTYDGVRLSLKAGSCPTLNVPKYGKEIKNPVSYEDHIEGLPVVQEFLRRKHGYPSIADTCTEQSGYKCEPPCADPPATHSHSINSSHPLDGETQSKTDGIGKTQSKRDGMAPIQDGISDPFTQMAQNQILLAASLSELVADQKQLVASQKEMVAVVRDGVNAIREALALFKK